MDSGTWFKRQTGNGLGSIVDAWQECASENASSGEGEKPVTMGRGNSKQSARLIVAAHRILADIHPASVRAVCYKLFTEGLLSSMSKNETNKVSRLLTWAREWRVIPWDWIVDETRKAERPGTWKDSTAFAQAAMDGFRRDYWQYQNVHVEVWSEKGTVRGTVAPVLQDYGITFRVFHGYGSACS